jgi:hypothetical protein
MLAKTALEAGGGIALVTDMGRWREKKEETLISMRQISISNSHFIQCQIIHTCRM